MNDKNMTKEQAQHTFELLVNMGNARLNAETDDEVEEATIRIREDALEVKTTKHYEIAVTLGGPNIWLHGELNEHNEPTTAQLECRWGTDKETIEPSNQKDKDALLEYARQFYF